MQTFTVVNNSTGDLFLNDGTFIGFGKQLTGVRKLSALDMDVRARGLITVTPKPVLYTVDSAYYPTGSVEAQRETDILGKVSAADIITAVASNNAFVAFAQSHGISAGALLAGSVIKAKALIVVNNASGSDTLTCEMRIGGTTIVASTAVDPGATTDRHLLEAEIAVRADPAAAVSLVGHGQWLTNTGGTIARGDGYLPPTNFATNGDLALDVRAKWSSNTANTAARLEMFNMEIV